MITIPGFRAAACLGSAVATASRRHAIDEADGSVRPAQWPRLDSIINVLRVAREERHPLEADCPLGQRPELVCVDPIPIIYCEWTGAGTYRCWVEKWKCLPGGYEWQCQPIEFRPVTR
jgi:hypothetical protein